MPSVTRVAGIDERTPVALPSAPETIPAPVMIARRVPVSFSVATRLAESPSLDLAPPPASLMIALASDLPYALQVAMADVPNFDVSADSTLIRMEDLGPRPVLTTGDATDDSHGLLSDAFRRARESLRGARWFLGDKIQGAVGAVKRASPFWDASGVQPR